MMKQQFVCNIRVMTELCVNGMNDLATKVADYSRLILLHFLQSKLLVSVEFWHQLMNIIAGLLPYLQVPKFKKLDYSFDFVLFSVMEIKLIH